MGRGGSSREGFRVRSLSSDGRRASSDRGGDGYMARSVAKELRPGNWTRSRSPPLELPLREAWLLSDTDLGSGVVAPGVRDRLKVG